MQSVSPFIDLLSGIGGCGVGLFMLLRRRKVVEALAASSDAARRTWHGRDVRPSGKAVANFLVPLMAILFLVAGLRVAFQAAVALLR
jgi:hypothetical protein